MPKAESLTNKSPCSNRLDSESNIKIDDQSADCLGIKHPSGAYGQNFVTVR
jgi:hypothetical protein